MAGKKRDAKKRAADLRAQINKLKSPEPLVDGDESEMKPGESPKEYLERRLHEGGFRKGNHGNSG
jgi:hypothetical protein